MMSTERCDAELARLEAEGAKGSLPTWLLALAEADWTAERYFHETPVTSKPAKTSHNVGENAPKQTER